MTCGLYVTKESVPALLPPGGLRVLAPHPDPPVVPDPAVGADLLQALEIITERNVQVVRQLLRVFAVLDVLLPVKEPVRDPVLPRVLHDRHKLMTSSSVS